MTKVPNKLPTKNTGFALNLIADINAPLADRLNVIEKSIPDLKPGQVLVKMLASPVNPSDLVYLKGQYGLPPVAGAFAGFEGCGEVISANAGLYGKWLVGKRVALSAEPGGDGLWGQYAVTQANYCLPVRADIDSIQASTLIVNPCTSVCLVERAIELGARAIVINAAASQVGKGVIRYAKMRNLITIAVVRSESNVKVLTELGADEVLLTTVDEYREQLKHLCQKHQATVLLDAVADQDTPFIMSSMPAKSTAIVYGRLSESLSEYGGQFSVGDVIFKQHKIEGFWLATYMRKAKPWQVIGLSRKVQKLFSQEVFSTDIYGQFEPQNFIQALEHYAENKSDGKVILSWK